MGGEPVARALYRCEVIDGARAPFDRVSLKIHYPAELTGSDLERNTGLVAAAGDGQPFPVIIILPGINVGPESYGWLAADVAARGNVVVTYSVIAEELPGYVSLTPGLDLAAIMPDSYGTRPSATALEPVLEALRKLNADGPLADAIDMNAITLLGHSAGGSVALYNAKREWVPGLRGVITWGAHAGAATALGFPENTFLPLPGEVPVMLLGGSSDGVIRNSAHRYGSNASGSMGPLRATFERSFEDDSGHRYLVEIAGANHFSLAWPVDETTGRHFIDDVATVNGESLRAWLADVLASFAAGNFGQVDALLDNELVAASERR